MRFKFNKLLKHNVTHWQSDRVTQVALEGALEEFKLDPALMLMSECAEFAYFGRMLNRTLARTASP